MHIKADIEEMVFCFHIVLTYCGKQNQEKLLKFETEALRFAKTIEITSPFFWMQWKVRTIFETEYFLNLFLEVSQI